MTADCGHLQVIAGAVASLAGIDDEHVELSENADGTFTLLVCGVARTGGLVVVLAWGFAEARAIARQIADAWTSRRP